MPNHIANIITFKCPKARMLEVLREIKYDANENGENFGSFDFNKVIPMPENISSAYPLSSPSFLERSRNKGLTFFERYLVKSIDAGTVSVKIRIMGFDILHIKTSEPMTV